MNLSRKRRRELRRLRAEAQELLDQQRVVLGHAGTVIQSAGRQARALSDEHLAPRVEETWSAVQPRVERGVSAARRAGDTVRRATAPFVTGALAGTVSALNRLENANAAAEVRRFGERVGYLEPVKPKKKVGGIIALILGVTAAAAVGIAIARAFRTDDDLWVNAEG